MAAVTIEVADAAIVIGDGGSESRSLYLLWFPTPDSLMVDHCRLCGTSLLLASGMGTPIGILLDRLEEQPEECEAPAELVREAVRWLRERHPNGI